MALMRVLLPSAAILAVANDCGVSVEFLRSFLCVRVVGSLSESEMTEGGRESGVALNTEESLRCTFLVDWTGVLPAVPRTPIFRLICRNIKMSECTQEKNNKRTYQFKLLLLRIQRNVQSLYITLV